MEVRALVLVGVLLAAAVISLVLEGVLDSTILVLEGVLVAVGVVGVFGVRVLDGVLVLVEDWLGSEVFSNNWVCNWIIYFPASGNLSEMARVFWCGK